MSSGDHLRLDDQLCFALYAAANAITRSYAPLLGQIDLTYPQYLVMLVLWQDGTSTVSAIAKRLELTPNSVTPLLDRLEKSGFVERMRNSEDRRVIHVRLSERGMALEAVAADAQALVQCRTGLSDTPLAELREQLRSLSAQLFKNESRTIEEIRREEAAVLDGPQKP
ncbi:transcriptional regulator (MarR family) protein [Fulvimarina pelagi HTCC2506]|uniref:Transcriptional regulator (MarR family) protein n=1 Tax=Fulvimarina pelagi HTCC2506 TaxID=314231 RepID=Q0G2R8_9HYPH|nr:MarR family transcriptional regulator [Fulvimarina pelagi]EAU42113.1 transcriptional regulator (MarR family) protein [Fulvimarina pelagi HTCC2506]